MINPKPCPWCAEEPFVISKSFDWGYLVKIGCDKCDYHRQFDYDDILGKGYATSLAIMDWNKRI